MPKSKKQLKSENLRRQMKTLIGKLDDMHKNFGIEIYFQAHGIGKPKIYVTSWPPGVQEFLVCQRI